MLGQSENCGFLTANIPKRYLKLGTCGKSVPGVKTKVVPLTDSMIKTPRVDSSSDQVGDVRCKNDDLLMPSLKISFSMDRFVVGVEMFSWAI